MEISRFFQCYWLGGGGGGGTPHRRILLFCKIVEIFGPSNKFFINSLGLTNFR